MKLFYTFLVSLLTLNACAQKKDQAYTSPEGYNLNKPDIIKLPAELEEISGLTFYPGNTDILFAEQDEDGYVYFFNPNQTALTVQKNKFGKKGDYEDIAIFKDQFVLLRSDGTFFSFPFQINPNLPAEETKEWKDLIPSGEYEGLATDQEHLYVLCKQCATDKKKDQLSGYMLNFTKEGKLIKTGEFSLNSKQIDNLQKIKGGAFRPSAFTKNPFTNEWFVLSSINKLLTVTDEHWQVKAVYKLDPKLYNQPEGIAFDSNRCLYISNEAGNKKHATILKFNYSNH